MFEREGAEIEYGGEGGERGEGEREINRDR